MIPRLQPTPITCATLFAVVGAFLPSAAQQAQPPASDLLQRAVHFADLYNWADAAPDFAAAEKIFAAAADERNALYARLGNIRSTIEQRVLPETSAQLAAELDSNPLLQTDKQLRMFCLIVKGDIDGELQSREMRQDWEQVQALAEELGDSKWQYRSLAQLGLAAFFDGDLATARKNVVSALIAATKAGDAGAQIRFLTVIGIGLLNSQMYEPTLPYFDKALAIAKATPDAGYPYLTNEARMRALIGLKQFDAAQRLVDEILTHARDQHRNSQQAFVLTYAAIIARSRNDDQAALSDLEQAAALSEAGGFVLARAEAQAALADIYRDHGDFRKAEQFAALAAASTQSSGDTWSVPARLQVLAEIQVSEGKYAEADHVYDRASAFIDPLIGSYSSLLEKTALITASSEIYSRHFSLVAERFNDPAKAYSIVEQVRGRATADLLMAGSVASDEAKKAERAIAQLRLKLTTARSTDDLHRLRDQIFMAEQSRWITPEVSILKAKSHDTIALDRVQRSLSDSAVILEYVVADPRSYCLVISHGGSHIVPLASARRIDALVTAYLKAVRAKQPAHAESRSLYDLLLGPIPEAARKGTLVVIRDGRLHLVPFDALIDGTGRYVAESHTVAYSPSASSFYLLATETRRPRRFSHALLAIGGVPYSPGELKQVSLTRGYDAHDTSDLPASKFEVLAAEAAVHDRSSTILLGPNATESAFKRADLGQYRVIHLAVHGFASTTYPNRAALVLLSDPAKGEDGFLQASEIVQLPLKADLVILSACDTAVGPVQGEEGIATLSKAFLLAGARAVVSTLWSIDDTFSLYLMKQFYRHLALHQPPAYALTAAKRDMLRKFGRAEVPYYWAAFTFEGAVDRAIVAIR